MMQAGCRISVYDKFKMTIPFVPSIGQINQADPDFGVNPNDTYLHALGQTFAYWCSEQEAWTENYVQECSYLSAEWSSIGMPWPQGGGWHDVLVTLFVLTSFAGAFDPELDLAIAPALDDGAADLTADGLSSLGDLSGVDSLVGELEASGGSQDAIDGLLDDGITSDQDGETVAIDGNKLCPTDSFSPDTSVLLADGTAKPIADIKTGDKVTATDPATGQSRAEAVTALHDNLDTDLAEVYLGDVVIDTTAGHLFWDETTDRWTRANELRPGDLLRSTDGQTAAVTDVLEGTGEAERLNLTVDQLHSYYVIAGATPVLVHNDPDECTPSITIQGGPPDSPPIDQTRAMVGEPSTVPLPDPADLPVPTTVAGKIKFALAMLGQIADNIHNVFGG